MSRPRRRTSAGISLGVIIALIVAIFGSRTQRQPAPEPPAATPAAAPAAASPTPSAPAAPAPAPTAADASRPGSPGFTSRRSLVEHYEKHGEEFPGLSMAAYLAAAQSLRDAEPGGAVLEVRRADGVITRFDRTNGAFLAFNRDGTIRTFFRPNDGERYFRRQATRVPGGGP